MQIIILNILGSEYLSSKKLWWDMFVLEKDQVFICVCVCVFSPWLLEIRRSFWAKSLGFIVCKHSVLISTEILSMIKESYLQTTVSFEYWIKTVRYKEWLSMIYNFGVQSPLLSMEIVLGTISCKYHFFFLYDWIFGLSSL